MVKASAQPELALVVLSPLWFRDLQTDTTIERLLGKFIRLTSLLSCQICGVLPIQKLESLRLLRSIELESPFHSDAYGWYFKLRAFRLHPINSLPAYTGVLNRSYGASE